MSLILMMIYWVVIPILVLVSTCWLFRRIGRPLGKGLVIVVAIGLLSWFIWEAVGKKMYWDAKVREMCAKDGGIRVYETVELPGEKFNKFEIVYIPLKVKSGPDDDFFYEFDVFYFRKGDPEIWRNHFKIIRREDSKILGEAVSYGRRGGDIPGPWHDSSFGCPKEGDISFLKKHVFIKAKQNGKEGAL